MKNLIFGGIITSMSAINTYELTDAARSSIISYVTKNQEQWDKELTASTKDSRFIRRSKSDLHFSIEYWKDKTTLVYTKTPFAWGKYKRVSYAYDVRTGVPYARVRSGNVQDLKKEAKLIDLFHKTKGVIQNLRRSSYLDKKNKYEKFHLIQELYTFTLRSFRMSELNDAGWKTVILNLMGGLAAIHEKGVAHSDIHPDNLLIKMEEGVVKKAVICDFGRATTDTWDFMRSKEVGHLLGDIFMWKCKIQEKDCPEFIKELVGKSYIPRYMVTSKDALNKLKAYYEKI